jgi:hypothetical protein
MTRLVVAVVGVLVALALILAGVYLVAGLGVALIVVGVLLGAASLLLVPVDSERNSKR